ncbi:MAG TPA: serine hydrolase domain-containing protein, partial [Gemmatimonadaceae bacterium]|nr:serine hydrolase domain-containing protein [Gemmatimonadaceae bacterium]
MTRELTPRSTLFKIAVLSCLVGRIAPPAAAQPALVGARAQLPIKATELASFINPIINAQLEKEHIPGAVFVLVQDGKILYQRGYGFADLERRKPVDPFTTIWRIGSISKVFTATATVQLADRGRFRLTDDVNQYLTRFKVPPTYAEPVRFWHLLTHTAGFDEIRPGTRADTEAGLLSLGDFLAPKLRRLRPPGQIISYSTYGISLAGYLVEQVSGSDFETYLRQNIWTPLGMRHTSIAVPARLRDDVAKGYEWENGTNRPAEWEWYHSTPASSINSSAVDMAQFIIALLQFGRYERTRILSERAGRDLLRQHFTSHPQLAGFAYGFYEDFTNGE